jgi:membrane protease YdiL (CAAX protease family)
MATESVPLIRVVVNRWRMFDAIVVGLLLFVVMALALLILGFPGDLRQLTYLTELQRSLLVTIIGSVLELVLAGALVIRIARKRQLGDPLTSIGWNLNNPGAFWGLGGLGLAGVVTLVSRYLFGAPGRFTDGFALGSIGLYLLGTVILQPFIEECYFRGILFVALTEKVGEVGTVITTAVLFAALHPSHRLTILPVGLVLGVARVKTRSVATCFVVHAAYNLGILIFQLLWWR